MSLLEFQARLRYPSGFVFDVAFEADSGVTALLGPSGSGKTTALSIIAGLRRPDAGLIRLGSTVLFDSERGIDLPPESRRIGYVFQQHLLFPHLTVRENLLYGWKRRASEARRVDPHRVIAALELADFLDRPPLSLSGGQGQRVALGRALLCSPEILLLDEPLASVDEDLKQQAFAHLDEVLAEWCIPMLYVTHDPAEVQRMCAQTIQLRNGHLVAAAK